MEDTNEIFQKRCDFNNNLDEYANAFTGALILIDRLSIGRPIEIKQRLEKQLKDICDCVIKLARVDKDNCDITYELLNKWRMTEWDGDYPIGCSTDKVNIEHMSILDGLPF